MSSTFYGNMVNLLNAQFQFDREYSNYKELLDNTIKDGVYIGRHSLVRYEKDPDNLETFKGVLDSADIIDPKKFLNNTSGYISYLLLNNLRLYDLTPDEKNIITIPICKYPIKINVTSDIILATQQMGNRRAIKILMVAAEGVDLTDYEFSYKDNKIICVKKNDENKAEIVVLENYMDSQALSLKLNKSIIQRAVGFYVEKHLNSWVTWLKCAYYPTGSDTLITGNIPEIELSAFLNLPSTQNYKFDFQFVPIGYISKGTTIDYVADTGEEVKKKTSFLVCDTNYEYYSTYIAEDVEKDKFWWICSMPENFYTNSELQFYNKDNKKSYNLYKKSENTIFQPAIVSSEYLKDVEYYTSIPLAHFKVIELDDNFEVNKLIDNYYAPNNSIKTYDFEHELNYDLTVWKKQYIDQQEIYNEVTGFKLPNMNYNLVKDGVLTVDEDNKIKGKTLRGLGKMAITYQDDTIDLTHERSHLDTRYLGEYDAKPNEIRTLAFPKPIIEVDFGYQTKTELTDLEGYNNYQTTYIEIAPSEGEDKVGYFWVATADEQGRVNNISIDNTSKTLESAIANAGIGKYVVGMLQKPLEENGDYIVYKISDNKYEITTINDIQYYVLYSIKILEDEAVDGNGYKPFKVYYDIDKNETSTYFKLPSFEIDEYGHINESRNVSCRLPALEGDKFTVEFSNLDANYAKTAGVAYDLAPTVDFKVGYTKRNSNSYIGMGVSKEKSFTWTLDDIGLDIEYDNKDNLEGARYLYPVAQRLKNATSIQLGNATKTYTFGKDVPLIFSLEEMGAMPTASGAGDEDLLINGIASIISAKDNTWQSSNEGIVFNTNESSFKIGDVFRANFDGVEATVKEIILTENSYGINLPSDPVEGQLFFKLEDASLEGGL